VEHKVNGQRLASYSFDADGLLVQAGSLVISRDSQTGFVVGSQAGVVEEERRYNAFGELVEQVFRVSGSPLLVVRYERDALGRVVAKEEEQQGQLTRWEYGYDGAGRLILERKVLPDGSVLETQWSYDANGNRIQEVKPSGETVLGSYDDQDRLLAYGDVTFIYTHNGELFSKCQGTACQQFTYDVFGNLRQVVLDNGQVIEYLVDGRNRRIGKKIDGALVQGWLYDDQLRILAELDGQANVVARFVYADGINVPELVEKGGRTYRLIKDQLGSVRLVVDVEDGSIVQEMRYDAWGNVVFDSNPGFQPFGFAGGLYDPHTRLVRFGARDYDASIGRWLSKDPLLFLAGANVFEYGKGSPVTLRDADGLCPSQCPNYPVGCGTPPNPNCGCKCEPLRKSLRNANQFIRMCRNGEPLEDGPPLRVEGSVVCPGTPPDEAGWIYPNCTAWPFNPNLRCTGDTCVDYCACRHEWQHYKDARPFNIRWTDLRLFCHFELPAYEEEALCLARFASMLGC